MGNRTPCFLGGLEQIAFTELVLGMVEELSANLPVLLRGDHPHSPPKDLGSVYSIRENWPSTTKNRIVVSTP